MATEDPADKPWGGRFSAPTDAFVEAFTASVTFDKRLAPYDIEGSIVHARMLAAGGILSQADATQIIAGLEDVAQTIAEDRFEWSVALEDVHMNIEHALVERIGGSGQEATHRALAKRPGGD